jgi:hypothetical protein
MRSESAPVTQPLELRVTCRVLQTHGLHVESIAGDVVVQVEAVDRAEGVGGTVDLVIVCTKAWQVSGYTSGSVQFGIALTYLTLAPGWCVIRWQTQHLSGNRCWAPRRSYCLCRYYSFVSLRARSRNS